MLHVTRMFLMVGGLCVALVVLAGCEMETRVVKKAWWDELAANHGGMGGGGGGGANAAASGTWTIALERYSGAGRLNRANGLIAQLQQETSLRDLWMEDVDGTAVVYRGRYADPTSEEARLALQQTRRIEVDGERPFVEARMTNLRADGRERVTDEYDLRQYPGFYTLQIGFYDAQFGRDFRDAAEEAARELREQGHDAYYYHGPHRSLIAVGLFTYHEAFMTADDPSSPHAQVDAYAPMIRELQEEFPYNLNNGVTVIDHDQEGERVGERQSFLVRVF